MLYCIFIMQLLTMTIKLELKKFKSKKANKGREEGRKKNLNGNAKLDTDSVAIWNVQISAPNVLFFFLVVPVSVPFPISTSRPLNRHRAVSACAHARACVRACVYVRACTHLCVRERERERERERARARAS